MKSENNSIALSKTGFSLVTIRFKIQINKARKFLPELAFLGHLTLSYVGEPKFTPEFVAPDFRIAPKKSLSKDISIGANLGGDWSGESPETHFFYSTVIGAGFTDKIVFLQNYMADRKSVV